MKQVSLPGLSFCTAAAILAFSFFTSRAFAQIGALDPDFATAGIGTYLLGIPYPGEDFEILALADNSMLVCGYYYFSEDTTYIGFVTHILESGDVDPTFGESNGTTFFNGGEIRTLALAADQSIYLAGSVADPPHTLLAHLSASGIPDADFGTNGVVITAIPSGPARCNDIVIQPDGKILLGGYIYEESPPYDSQSLFMRLLPDGTLDTSFNSTGIVTVPGNPSEYLQALALLDDGSIMGVGEYNNNATASNSLLLKLSPDGTLDTSFGIGGSLDYDIDNGSSEASEIIILDGSIYTVGFTSHPGSAHAYIAKFNTDGSFDSAFGTNGSTLCDFGVAGGVDAFYDIVAQPDGKMLACGYAGYGSCVTARFGTNGALDPTFGDEGKTITDITVPHYAALSGIALQPDGKIVAVGVAYILPDYASVIVLRYLGNGSVDIVGNETPTDHVGLYPNPISGNATTLELRDAQSAEVWTSDLQGRTIGSTINVPNGVTSVSLDANGLAAGTYLVNVLSQGNITTLKMQVAK
jgi:uncharacterized delta-60 repeat protein